MHNGNSALNQLRNSLVVFGLTILSALIIKALFGSNDIIGFFWLVAGPAVYLTIRCGYRILFVILAAVISGFLLQGIGPETSVPDAVRAVLTVGIGTWLFRKTGGDPLSFNKVKDYLRLFGAAVAMGLGSAGITALQLRLGLLPDDLHGTLHQVAGTAFGVVITMSPLLVWHNRTSEKYDNRTVLEGVALIGLSILAGQVVFLDWLQSSLGQIARGYWMFLFVTIAALRLRATGTLAVMLITSVQALAGALGHRGFFSDDIAKTHLLNFFFYMLSISSDGLLVAMLFSQTDEAKKQIEAKEEQYRLLSNNIPGGMTYQLDTGFSGEIREFTYMSTGVEKLHSLSVEAVKNEPGLLYGQYLEADQALLEAEEARALSTMTAFSAEARYRLKSGEIRWSLFAAAPHRAPNGHLLWDGIEIDITKRKRTEDALRESNERLAAVLNAQKEIAKASFDSTDMQQTVMRCMERLTGADGAGLEIVDGDEIVYEAATGIAAPHIGLRMKKTESLSGLCMVRGEVMRSDDSETDQRVEREACRRIGLRSMVLLPLRYGKDAYGVLKLMSTRVGAFSDETEHIVQLMGEFLSVTISKNRTALSLMASEERFHRLFQESPAPLCLVSDTGVILDRNDRFNDLFGYSPAELATLDDWWARAYPDPEYRALMLNNWLIATAEASGDDNGGNDAREARIVCKNGSERVMLLNSMALSGSVLVTFHDITQRHAVELELRRSEERLRLFIEHAPAALAMFDREMRYIVASRRWLTDYGLQGRSTAGLSHYEVFPDIGERWKEVHRRGLGGEVITADCDRFEREDGSVQWLSWEVRPWFDNRGGIGGIIIFSEDITGEKNAEHAVRESEERFRTLFDRAPIALSLSDRAGNIVTMNQEFINLFGYGQEELPTVREWRQRALPDEEQQAWNLRDWEDRWTAAEDDHALQYREQEIVSRDGGRKTILTTRLRLSRDMLLVAVDITARKKMETELLKSATFIQNILQSVGQGFIVVDPEYRIIRANRSFCEQAGWPEEELIGRPCHEVSHNLHLPCFTSGESCPVKNVFTTARASTLIHMHHNSQGKAVHTEVAAYPMKDEAGRVYAAIETVVDITERLNLEGQLRHAQKIEGIGQLAGGIAHDFNNVLSAIIGYANLLQLRMDEADPLRHFVDEIAAAGDRGASITQQILAFSRKQVLDIRPVNLNMLIRSLEKMLHRLVREDISLELKLVEKELVARVDASQIDQVLINFTTNARDAMPDGGKITISTEPVVLDNAYTSVHGGEPGSYAVITFSDTGHGMNEEVISHIFEPFFTTKEVGKGTGLGLAVVHGIIRQHKGHITVYSESGSGTVFKVYLPLAEQTGDRAPETADAPVRGGSECVLIAEDDAFLRQYLSSVLSSYGYEVKTAADGDEAAAMFKNNQNLFQIVLLDGIMPRKNGKEVYREITACRPDMKVIFMSGYAEDIFTHDGIPEEEIVFLQKPVKTADLLRALRSVLDGER